MGILGTSVEQYEIAIALIRHLLMGQVEVSSPEIDKDALWKSSEEMNEIAEDILAKFDGSFTFFGGIGTPGSGECKYTISIEVRVRATPQDTAQ